MESYVALHAPHPARSGRALIPHARRVVPNEVLEVNSVAAIVDLVRQNVGIAIVPLLKHVAWARDRSIVPLALPHRPPARIVGMVESGSHPAITGAVRQQLLQAIG